MISVKKYEDEFGTQAVLTFPNGQDIIINYSGNFDLYLTPESNDIRPRESLLYEIDESEDYDLYHIFDDMHRKVTSYKPTEGREDKNFKFYDENRPNPLVKDGMIRWLSDDEPEEIAASVMIYKQNGKICIFFTEGLHLNGNRTKTIRFATDGSRYRNFFVPFMELYNQICQTDFEQHQITMDEYLLTLKAGKKIS